MGEQTEIVWCDHTWSPWEGCQKVGDGCQHCYAETRNTRFGGGNWGPGAPRRLTADSGWKKPLAYNRDAAAAGWQRTIFPSLCDPFDNAAPEGARDRLAALIRVTPNLTWLLLTKRIGNARAMLIEMFDDDQPDNVWLGATVVNQQEANRDIPVLLTTPAAKRFLSIEPMLEPVKLRRISTFQFRGAEVLNALTGKLEGMFGDFCSTRLPALDWVIVGGESGHGAREMRDEWALPIVEDCRVAGVPVLVKQIGSAAGLKHPKGGDPEEWPEALRVRQFPA